MNAPLERHTAAQLLATGCAHEAAGRVPDAIAHYRRALRLDPNLFGACNNLGNLLRLHGNLDEATVLLVRATALDPAVAGAHHNLALAHIAANRFDAGLAAARRSIACDATDALAHLTLATLLQATGAWDDAARAYETLLALTPDDHRALGNLGAVRLAQNRRDDALALFRAALQRAPDDPEHLTNLGTALPDPDEAIATLRRAVALRPDCADAHDNLGNILFVAERYDDALASFDAATARRPALARAHRNRGAALAELDRLEEAVAAYEHAIALDPTDPTAPYNLGIALWRRGDLDRADDAFRRALALDPASPRARNNLSRLQLSRGDFAEGWRGQECRWESDSLAGSRRTFPQPQWQGEPAAGRTLLIHAEQGFGDTIQFCRYVPLAKALGLRVILEVQKPLVRLLRSLEGADHVLARGDPPPPFDLHCPTLSLPLAFGTTLETIPCPPAPYLAPDQAEAAAWSARLAGLDDRPRVGLVWQGCSDFRFDRDRSISPERMAALLSVPGIHFFSLQKAGPALPDGTRLIDLMPEMADFAATAALIANLDLVIAVDTAVAHLAAAIGKPVWLLDRHHCCWRWLLGRTDSPWYPTLRIIRQPARADWDSVLATVTHDLAAFRDAHPSRLNQAAPPSPTPAQPYSRRDVLARTLFDTARAQHRQGDTDAAIASYRHAIRLNPDAAEAHNNLGCLLRAAGDRDSALACFRQAARLCPDIAGVHRNLGDALAAAGNHDEALTAYARAIALDPGDAPAHAGLGRTLRDLGRHMQAARSLHRAVQLAPNDPVAHNDLGTVLLALAQPAEALAAFERAVSLDPAYRIAAVNAATALSRGSRHAEAIALLEQVITQAPGLSAAHNNLGNEHFAAERWDEAIASYRHVVALTPDDTTAYNNLGAALAATGRNREAIVALRHAIALAPSHAPAHYNLGNALWDTGWLDRAAAAFRAAIARDPDHVQAHNNLARILLAQGRLAEGWHEHEWRWRTPELRHVARAFPQPQWRGEPGPGTILIHHEQGFGDMLQFCRYVPLLAARGLTVILECPAPLARLLRRLPGLAALVTAGENLPPFDLHCPALSLPLAFGTTLETIPTAPAYLHPDPAASAAWSNRLAALAGDNRRVGLVWAGNPALKLDRERSLPPETLIPLAAAAAHHNITLVSLQKSAPPAPSALPLIDLMPEMADFADTAALIANLDLVIAVDTAVAHLAAALGKPVWLLDRHKPCWRWLLGRRDSPWYPSLRIYRQPSPGDWTSVLTEVTADLRATAHQFDPSLAGAGP